MLVKFISYIITVFGTKRYKPVLFAGLALVATLVGANTVLSLYRAQPHSAASTINQEQEQGTESQGISKQGLQKQAPADTNKVPAATAPAPTQSTTQPTTEQRTAITTTADNGITMKRDSNGTATSQSITATISDGSKVQWLVIPQENTLGLNVIGTSDKSSTSNVSFSLKSDSTLPTGQYSVTIHVKDSGRGLDLTKTIIVTITAE